MIITIKSINEELKPDSTPKHIEWTAVGADGKEIKVKFYPTLQIEEKWLHFEERWDEFKNATDKTYEIDRANIKLENNRVWKPVIKATEVKDVFKQKAVAEVQTQATGTREASIETQVAIKEIGECWRADKMKDDEPEVLAYRAWILDKLNGYMKGAKDVKTTEELPKEEILPGTRGVDDTGGGTQVTNAQTLMKYALSHGKEYTPSWVKKEALLGDGAISEEAAKEAQQLLKKNMNWGD